MSARQLQLREVLQRLSNAEIRFVLVGGLAVNAWGYLRTPRDLDVVPDPSKWRLRFQRPVASYKPLTQRRFSPISSPL